MSSTQTRFLRLFESLLCRSSKHEEHCKCASIKKTYGSKPFKCGHFGCLASRIGFESAEGRDIHLATHERPYRCDWSDCEFGHIGFASQARLDAHLKLHRTDDTASQTSKTSRDTGVARSGMREILLDAVEADNNDVIRAFASEVPWFADILLNQAVKTASPETLNLLLTICGRELVSQKTNILKTAIVSDNLDAARILVNEYFHEHTIIYGDTYLILAIRFGLPDMVKLLSHYLPKRREDFNLPWSGNLLLKEYSPEYEAMVIQCLDLLKTWAKTTGNFFPVYFRDNSMTTLSLTIARYLLQNGVDIDTTENLRSATALYLASKDKSLRAAELMKFLLESGAYPQQRSNGKRGPISKRPGPANISKWFGITWEQLVEESRKVYAASTMTAVASETAKADFRERSPI